MFILQDVTCVVVVVVELHCLIQKAVSVTWPGLIDIIGVGCFLLSQLSWELKIKKNLKTVPPCLGKFRPTVGQCCHQCTPDSLVSMKEK